MKTKYTVHYRTNRGILQVMKILLFIIKGTFSQALDNRPDIPLLNILVHFVIISSRLGRKFYYFFETKIPNYVICSENHENQAYVVEDVDDPRND